MLKNFKICDDLDVCLNQLHNNPKLAVAVTSEYIRSNRLFPAYHFYCFEKHEIINSFTSKFLVRQNFSHLDKFNRFLKIITMHGILTKWQSIQRAQYHKRPPDRTYGVLKLAHFHGTQIIWFFLKLSAILLFFGEIYTHKKARDPRSSRFWTVADKIICPDRSVLVKNKAIH